MGTLLKKTHLCSTDSNFLYYSSAFSEVKKFLWNDSEAEYRLKLQGFESVLAHCVQAFLKDAKLFLRFSRFCFLWSCSYRLLINIVDTDIVSSSTVVYVALSYSLFKVLPALECFTGLTPQYQELWLWKTATLPVEVEKSVLWTFILALWYDHIWYFLPFL